MLTINDAKAREVLVATHSQFSDRLNWKSGGYGVNPLSRPHGFQFTPRCLMGEIGAQTGAWTSTGLYTSFVPLYTSIWRWLQREILALDPHALGNGAPESYNDAMGYEAVMQFLVARITQLEHELRLDANIQAVCVQSVVHHLEAPDDEPAVDDDWWSTVMTALLHHTPQACTARRLPERVM